MIFEDEKTNNEIITVEANEEIVVAEETTELAIVEETSEVAEVSEVPEVELSEEEKAAAALDLKLKLEGLIFASEEPLTVRQLRGLFPENEAPELSNIRDALEELEKDYENRGVHLVEVSSGYCFRATTLIAPYVGVMMAEKTPRYSRAFLETLSIIAYRQPITRGEIEQIRGVAVNSQILKTLQERDWIREVGHKEVPGKPALLATTKAFLDYFHLKQLSDLPPLAELLAEDAQMTIADEQVALAIEANTETTLSTEEAANAEISEVLTEDVVDAETSEILAEELAQEFIEVTDAVTEEVIEESVVASDDIEAEENSDEEENQVTSLA